MRAFSHSKSLGSFNTPIRMRIPGGLRVPTSSACIGPSRLLVCLLPKRLHASFVCGRTRPNTATRPSISTHSHSHNHGFSLARTVPDMASAKGNSGSKPPLMKRAVVSSFLYKFVQENGERKAKVALFKRSGQVRTYQ